MKTSLKISSWLKVVLYFLMLGLATIIAFTVPALADFWFFMLVSVMCSWLLLRTEGQTLANLNLIPRIPQHWLQLLYGTLAGIVLLLITTVVTFLLTGDTWHFNKAIDPVYILITLLSCLWSSVVQEFVFRGYPFQTMLAHYGAWKAQVFVAIPFALMHMNTGMHFQEVAVTFLTTGLGSVLFGLAYIKTRHLALPVGIHMGWNFAQSLVPRVAGSKGTTLISVSGEIQHYTFLNLTAPYVVIILIAIGFLFISKGWYKQMKLS